MLLRKPRAADAPLMFRAYAQDPAVTRYLTWRPHADIAETRAIIDRFLAAWEKHEEFCWLLFTNSAGQLLGSMGRGQRMVDSISAFFSHVLTGGAVTCRKRSP